MRSASVDVTENFLDGPFAGSVAKFGLLLGKRREQADEIALLILENFQKITARNERRRTFRSRGRSRPVAGVSVS